MAMDLQPQARHWPNNLSPNGAKWSNGGAGTFQQIVREAAADPRHYLKLVNNCDEGDPLLSETPLGARLAAVPLDSLGPGELAHAQMALNVEQLLPGSRGLARDYRGLAELMGFSSLELEARFKRSHNPTRSLLEAFALRARLAPSGGGGDGGAVASVGHLLTLLESLERFDIIDDLLPQLVHWAWAGLGANAGAGVAHAHGQRQLLRGRHQGHEQRRAEQGRPAPYDAFVCFAPEDFHYAEQLIELLEAHNRRLVTVDSLMPGRFEYDAIVQTIATECRKVIVLLTPNYLRSKDCDFQTKFASELALRAPGRQFDPRLIPVLCEPLPEDAQLPYMLRFMSKIDLTGSGGAQAQWQLRKLLFALDHELPSAGSVGSMGVGGGGGHRGALTHDGPLALEPADGLRPIVDLAYSQTTSSDLGLSCQLDSSLSIMTASTSVGHDDHEDDNRHGDHDHDHDHDHDRERDLTQRPETGEALPGPAVSAWQAAGAHGQPAAPGSQLNPLNWYKSIKQRVRGLRSASESTAGGGLSPSLSSRAVLLPPGDSEENLARADAAAAATAAATAADGERARR